jgi:redox-sensitive bicupin YhaK (pirin superfamily)
MKTQLIKAQNQARGAFDFGRIKENKPIGFPYEVGGLQSISNLFYWAHAWSDEGGLIEEHPHQGFEIMSYFIRGEQTHYDNKNNACKSLKAGGAQLIKSGNGITHTEKFMPNTAIFQI